MNRVLSTLVACLTLALTAAIGHAITIHQVAVFGGQGVYLEQVNRVMGGIVASDGDVLLMGASRVDGAYAKGTLTTQSTAKVYGTALGDTGVGFGGGTSLGTVDVFGNIYTTGNFATGTTVKVFGNATIGGNVTMLGGSTQVAGDLDVGANISGGDVNSGNNVKVGGTVTAGGSVDLGKGNLVSQNVLTGGDFSLGILGKVEGNVSANGNVVIGNNADVLGHVTHGGTLTLDGSAAVGSSSVGTAIVTPDTPFTYDQLTDIVLPGATAFTAGGADQSVTGWHNDLVLAPGTYGDLSATVYTNLYLSSGDYYFDSIDTGSNVDLYLDLTDGPFSLFVIGDLTWGTLFDTYYSTDNGASYALLDLSDPGLPAAAKQVMTEVHGNFRLSHGGSYMGRVFTPNGDIDLGRLVDHAGQLWAAGTVTTVNHTDVMLVRADTPPTTPIPEPVTAALAAIAGLGLAHTLTRRRPTV